mgnify:CR=1 FL=1
MLADLNFAILITAPVFLIVALGAWLKRLGWISDEFVRVGSILVFNISLPSLLFVKLAQTDFRHGLPLELIGYALLATTLAFVLLECCLGPWLARREDRGAFVQGVFRSNMGIVGLAYSLAAFGDPALVTASIYLGVLTILYNVLALITLTRHRAGGADGALRPARLLRGIVSNPLILSIIAGGGVSLAAIPVPAVLLQTGGYFADLALPLALLCTGASIRLREFRGSGTLYAAIAGKLLLLPLAITGGGVLLGLRGIELGVLYLMCAAPTAAASYPMARAMSANHHLAAAIVAGSTLGSIISTTLGIFVLRRLELI